MRQQRCFLLFIGAIAFGSNALAAPNDKGAVATVHPLATEAAVDSLRKGGNAIDAAVAAGLTLGVVDGHNSGIGGGCFLMLRRADGAVIAIDGRETAPAAASRDMYLRNGKADPALSQTGPLSVAVPGALAAYDLAARLYGKQPLKRHLENAAALAARGFVISKDYASQLQGTAADMRNFEATKKIFLRPNGDPLSAGDRLVQPDLAATYRAIARSGTEWFYDGPFARKTADWMRQNGGVLTKTDFARYVPKTREPLRTTYRGYEILGFPPPSSGGIHVAQILNIVEKFDLRSMGAGSPDFVHVLTEAMKLAFADRAFWLGDPDFAKVPRQLVAKRYGQELARQINLKKSSSVTGHHTPSAATDDYFGKHTTHFSTADSEGNWVACTATINTSFGSKVVVPETGVVLNNQMDDFSAEPGKPNFFGLIGADANAIAPGKRPLSSMSPTLVLMNGAPVLSVGAAGGPTIISQTVLAIVHTIDFGMDLKEALSQPRFHHQWRPDELIVEKSLPAGTVRELERRGHKVRVTDSLGAAQAVALRGGRFLAAHDPRLEGSAQTWSE